jgi:hypothetical protein
MSTNVSRRHFIAAGAAAAGTTAASAQATLPTRPFGKTGVNVSILAIGCGNRLWAAYGTPDRGVEALNLAIYTVPVTASSIEP